MSIVQEALKKAQRKEIHETIPAQSGPAHKKTPFKSVVPILFIIFIMAAIAAARQFSIMGTLSSKSKMLSEAQKFEDFIDTAPHQEVTYKPIEEKGADPELPSTPPPRFVLNGIMYLEDGPQAIVNNSRVREGDIVSSATVVKINRNSVLLNHKNVEITLILKK